MVLKPSELTPLTALALAELARRAGLPPGVVNVVCGDAAAIADVLLASPEVGGSVACLRKESDPV